MFKDQSDAEFLHAMELNVEAINRATEGIPRDHIRLHICWGNWEGPHTHDFPLAGLLPLLYRAKVGALSIEFANPRHQHEYEALRNNPLPPEMILIPGVIDTTTNFVEHPEVVANRICEAVGDGRRPQPRDRRHRLRLRHLGGPEAGVAGRGLGQACRHPRGRGYRDPQTLELTAITERPDLSVRPWNRLNLIYYCYSLCWIADSTQWPPRVRRKVQSSVDLDGSCSIRRPSSRRRYGRSSE